MARVRINEITRELKEQGYLVENNDLIEFCKKLNIQGVVSHSSSIEDDDANRLSNYARSNSQKGAPGATVKKRSSAAKQPAPEPTPPSEPVVTTTTRVVDGAAVEEVRKQGSSVIRRRRVQDSKSPEEEAQQQDEEAQDTAEQPVSEETPSFEAEPPREEVQPDEEALHEEEEDEETQTVQEVADNAEPVQAQAEKPAEKPADKFVIPKRKDAFQAEVLYRPPSPPPGSEEAEKSGETSEVKRDKDKFKRRKKKEAVESSIEVITSEGTNDKGSKILSTVPPEMKGGRFVLPQPDPSRQAEILYRPSPEETARAEEDGGAKKRDIKRKKSPLQKRGGKLEMSRREIFDQLDPSAQTQRQRRRRPVVKKVGKKTEITIPKAIKRIVRIEDTIIVGELAKAMSVKVSEVIKTLMNMGVTANINQSIDYEIASLVANEFNYEVQNVALKESDKLESADDSPEDLVPRSPVVTIMGHVDHGKTTLLDYIRKSHIVDGESGGITQHIGAYQVNTQYGKITFIDTPGHEAFTAMRMRGAKITDIVILIVAADDGIMPQTVEALNHAKAAEVPILVAINKCDLPEAKPERIQQQFMEHGIVSEQFGGDTPFVQVSAKKGEGVDSLLEYISLQAEMLDLKANPKKAARGAVIESKLDKGRGPVATALIQDGTIKIGDWALAGVYYGRVRGLINDLGENIKSAPPSTPVEVLGLSGVPDAGEDFHVAPDEKTAKQIIENRLDKLRQQKAASQKVSLDDLFAQMQGGEIKELKIVLKTDVQGTAEAIKSALEKIKTEKARVKVIHSGVGAINESDVMLAAAANAIVVGFHVRPDNPAKREAEKQKIDIRIFNIIYDAVEKITSSLKGMLEPTLEERFLGKAEIREVFSVPKIGKVAGCFVLEGKVVRNAYLRLIRDHVQVFEGKISSLRRFKNDVKEVTQGFECGIGIENCNDLKIGDFIEAYEMKEVESSETGAA